MFYEKYFPQLQFVKHHSPEPISFHWSFSIPPENIFLIFSECIKRENFHEMA